MGSSMGGFLRQAVRAVILFALLIMGSSLHAAADLCVPVGWATQNGGTTGGGNATPVTVTNISDLQTQASSSGSKVIIVSGTMGSGVGTRVVVSSNKTIFGLPGATLNGGFDVKNASNVILRNMIVKGPGAIDVDGVDCVTVQNSTNVWLDHLDLSDGQDGNCDVVDGSNYVSLTWVKFHYTSASTNHMFCDLLGNSDSKTSDRGKIKVTFQSCWWADGVLERMPRVRFGQVHVAGNLYTCTGNNQCVRAGLEADLLVEGNVFNGVKLPIDLYQNDFTAVTARNNSFINTTGNTAGSGTAFTPPYSLNLSSTSQVEAEVRAGAGATLKAFGCGSSQPTSTRTFTRTNTPVPPTNTPTRTFTSVPPTATFTRTATATRTFTATSTRTSTPTVSSTATRTHTPVPPTATFTATWTNTASSTPTRTSTATSTNTRTNTPVPSTATATRTSTPTNSFTAVPPSATATRTFTSTNSPVPPTATPTNSFTVVPPSATPTNSFTAVPPTVTRTFTSTNSPVPPSATPTRTFTTVPPTATVTNSSTLVPPSATPTRTSTFTAIPPTATFTNTPVPPTATPTFTFTSVPPSATPTSASSIQAVLYPNPATGSSVNIQVTGMRATDKVSVQIQSSSFRLITEVTYHSQGPGTANLVLNLVDATGVQLANGIYYVVVRTEGARITLKLMILR